MNAQIDTQTLSKSTFVTTLAWVFIVLSGFATLISIAQNIMIQTMFNDADLSGALATSQQSPDVPAAASFMASHFKVVFASFLLLFTTTLVSSIGLLKRRNWARWIFITLMALGIVWNVLGLVLQFVMFSSIPVPPVTSQDPVPFKSMFIVIMILSTAMAIGVSALFGWIIKRLISQPVIAEFEK